MASDNEILEELRRIRVLLEPKPVSITPPLDTGILGEFTEFISKYKVMGLAVAFILGLYLGELVKALVDDIIMPIVQLSVPGTAWESIEIGPFRIGHFIGAFITFLIVTIVIFGLVKLNKRIGIE